MRISILILIIIFPGLVISQNEINMHQQYSLKNKNLEVHIDLPLENYNFSRFDWTGKIVAVKFNGIYVTGVEKLNPENKNIIGQGFYNEFGIDKPIAFDETAEGEWFHKIGIGLLKKEGGHYDFSKKYEVQPATFSVTFEPNKVKITCNSQNVNGYSYILKKEIELFESSFVIRYHLQNTGNKRIITNEYNHNFIAINEELIGRDYILRFPFQINPELFAATVNPDEIVEFKQNEILFNNTPDEQFFFSNLSGGKNVDASWELINTKSKIGLSETGNFKTNSINLWGWHHVISPELFFDINIEPGQSIEWSRTYHVYEIN
jgi:hypothetical protein